MILQKYLQSKYWYIVRNAVLVIDDINIVVIIGQRY